MQERIRIDRATRDDRPALERLLISAGLETSGLDRERVQWVVARLGGMIVGCGSLELTSCGASLANLAVAVSHRRRSIGSTLVSVLLDCAADSGVGNVYAVVRDAAGFFRRLQWQSITRSEAVARAGLKVDGESQVFVVSLAERARAVRSGQPGGETATGVRQQVDAAELGAVSSEAARIEDRAVR